MRSVLPVAFAFALLLFSALEADDAKPLPAAADREVDFVADVQPILRKTCYSCHGSDKEEAGLRLDIKTRALDGGDSGKSIIPGDSATSRLIMLVAGLDEDAGIMPPEGEGTPLTSDRLPCCEPGSIKVRSGPTVLASRRRNQPLVVSTHLTSAAANPERFRVGQESDRCFHSATT